MKIELPPVQDNGNVISITSRLPAGYHLRKLEKLCTHDHVVIDETLNTLHCEDCNKDVNAVAWLNMLTSEWSRIDHLYNRCRAASFEYEAKKRCRCEHCGKLTKVKPPSSAEVREFNRIKGIEK